MKNNYDSEYYIILSSTCTITIGKNRTLICDYLRNELYFISNDYARLLELLNRNKIADVLKTVSEDSIQSFYEFIVFLTENEIVFLTHDLKLFPERKKKYKTFEYIKDAIIEINIDCFDQALFSKNINELNILMCNDIHLRILSHITVDKLRDILDIISLTSINYVEIHLSYGQDLSKNILFKIIEEFAILSHIYVYNSPSNEVSEFYKKSKDFYPILFGNIYYVKENFDSGNCCGSITEGSLDFQNINIHNDLKRENGCLYKKVTIDKDGNIKNCPSIATSFGNTKEFNIIDVLYTKEFKYLGDISKDSIKICKECEFRYNCTDCRAFLSNSNDIYSKPLKCGYNVDTFMWEEWSENVLQNKGIIYDKF